MVGGESGPAKSFYSDERRYQSDLQDTSPMQGDVRRHGGGSRHIGSRKERLRNYYMMGSVAPFENGRFQDDAGEGSADGLNRKT